MICRKPPEDAIDSLEPVEQMLDRHRSQFETRRAMQQESRDFVAGFLWGLTASLLMFAAGAGIIWLGTKAGV